MSRDASHETHGTSETLSRPASRVPPLVTLADWLSYQEQLHPKTIDLGLERLTRVLSRLKWQRPTSPIVTVGGTNGKGSCVAMLESIFSAASLKVATFTSPHLIRYNERIRIAQCEVSDEQLTDAFERIEAARGDISLTFFEFNALAALLIFELERPEAIILEVGLGGRLDAVNIVDADVAIVSSIALDHCDWLGNDVESIAREKAGIFRANRPAIFGSGRMPRTIASEAARVGAKLQRLGADFDFQITGTHWNWRCRERSLDGLPPPALPGAVQYENAATVLAAINALGERVSIDRSAIENGLQKVALPGRFQIVKRKCEWILDVAHNPAAAETLARNLANRSCEGRKIAICGMFADKDYAGVISTLRNEIDVWIVAGLKGTRALPPTQLAQTVEQQGGAVASVAVDVIAACREAESLVRAEDRVVVFGSFFTVGPALEWLTSGHAS